jgi:hypothetical protein
MNQEPSRLLKHICRFYPTGNLELNGNIISEDFTKDTIENYLHMLRNKPEKLVKDSFFYLFL